MRRGHPGGWRGGPPNRPYRHRSGGNPGYRPYRPHAPGGAGPHRYPLNYNSPRVPPWNHQVNTSRSSISEDDNSPHKDERRHHYDKHSPTKLYQHRSNDSYQSRTHHRDTTFHDKYMESIKYNPICWQNPQPTIPKFNNEPLLTTPDLISQNQSELIREYNEKKRNRNRDYDRRDYDRNYHDTQRQKHTTHEISQHSENNCSRPPTSNYFENNPRSDDSKSFTKSVDDTVSIIKERMMNRHNPSFSSVSVTPNDTYTDRIYERDGSNVNPTKINNSRQRRKNQNIKLSREFKNKIIGQLFNMNKDNIHKLMDNPNLSSKFEYAINSLITESQNSFNRHTRAAAEKSLYGDYIESNTIYEDTFMKQMQCILDPGETLVLTDLKPFVMAELNKFLQIDEFSNNYPTETYDDDDNLVMLEDSKDFYYNVENSDNRLNSEVEPKSYQDDNYNLEKNNCEANTEFLDDKQNIILEDNFEFNNTDNTQYFKVSRPATPTDSKNSYVCKSIEKKCEDTVRHFTNITEQETKAEDPPLFQNNVEQLSDDEDPFAEFDNQYHVAVDPSLNNEDFTNIVEIKTQPLVSNIKHTENKSRKSECGNNNDRLQDQNNTPEKNKNAAHIRKSNSVDKKNDSTESKNSSLYKRNNRKSSEESCVNRKEKRRNIDSKSEVNMLQNTVSNRVLKKQEKSSNVVGTKNLTASKNKHATPQKNKPLDISHSNKVVKDKKNNLLSPIIKLDQIKKEHDPISLKSPIDSIDGKTKLKTFDMFEQKSRKIQVHQAPRNTAPVQEAKTLINEKSKDKHTHKTTKIKRSVATQVINKTATRFTQTMHESYRKNKGIQTDEIMKEQNLNHKPSNIYDRMKEIDLEIQVLLQEKFKLYNSLESKEKSEKVMPIVGMTVLNVDNQGHIKNDMDNDISEDTIIDDIAKLSEEELEKIAFEGIGSAEDNIPDEQVLHIGSKKDTRKSNKKSRGSQFKKKKKIKVIKNIQNAKEKTPEINTNLNDTSIMTTKSAMKTRHRQNIKSNEPSSSPTVSDYSDIIKPCAVILIKKGLRELMGNINRSSKRKRNNKSALSASPQVPEYNKVIEEVEKLGEKVIVEEIPVINEFHFQDQVMVISEDIVIASNDDCEGSAGSQIALTDTYEEVVDNSSIDSGDILLDCKADTSPAPEDTPYRIYDMELDENDSIKVVGHADSVIAVESIENNFVAACVNGKMYYFDSNGQLLSTIKVSSNYGVSCLSIVEDKTGITVYAGSLDARLRYYDLISGLEKGPECNVLSPIQSMDRAWDIIYVGTRMGFVHQFECKNGTLFPLSRKQFSDHPILALKALKEGPRRVLLVASRSENVTIKDAQTGLLLRTFDGGKMTIYSLLYEEGKLFCGNPSNFIQTFDFASGSHTGSLSGGRGCICLRTSGGVIFAGCYNGSVYVFKSGRITPIAVLGGRSNVLLALAISSNKLIMAYNDRSLYIWKIPVHILEEMIL